MLTKNFYSLIDTELDTIIEKYKNDTFIKKHKSAINNQKSYALLIWFLDFYGRTSNYSNFVTDGNNDSSCDIVFDRLNNEGNKVFYIVQSKWNNAANAEKETEKTEILKALQDFETIWRGEKKNVNDKLKSKLDELDRHFKANGEVKFIFLSLSEYKGGADENINAFKKNDVKTKFEVIDIERIKTDYIDRNYKKIAPINPLETYQNPEEISITLNIVQKSGTVKIEKPYEAYVFLLRPKTIWELFKTYNFALFFKNVRNPLLQSQFNTDIEKTILEESSLFWYYNNGITAITSWFPEIGAKAETIQILGLQVINGAQTVYSVYHAYENASPAQRRKIDSDALITLRLIKSGGKKFDLNVTRFTNSQNPIKDRDFCANDDIQVALQNAFYKTNFWYEKRRDEFRETPKGVTEVPNFVFANAYLAYHLQDPVSVAQMNQEADSINLFQDPISAIKTDTQSLKIKKDLIFISRENYEHGFYEKIFNSNTSFEDMLCAFYLFRIIYINGNMIRISSAFISYKDTFRSDFYHILALFKAVFPKYLMAKYGEKVNVNKQIIKIYEQNEEDIIIKTAIYIHQFIRNKIVVADNDEASQDRWLSFLWNLADYQKMYKLLENTPISIKDIEDIVLPNNFDILEEDYK